MKKYQIEITVDTNDGDSITEVSLIDKESLEKIKPLIEEIGNFKPYKVGNWTHNNNYPYGEVYPRKDLGEKFPEEIYHNIIKDTFNVFEEYVPFGEHGFHTVESIYVYEVPKKEKLL